MKPTIIHFISDLGRGGAETLLVSTVKELKDFKNIILTINSKNEFEKELECDEYLSMNLNNPRSLFVIPKAVLKLRKIIREFKPSIVHSQLSIPDFIARLSTPHSTPLISTIQTSPKFSTDFQKWYIRSLNKLTYTLRPTTIVGCSNSAVVEYFDALRIQPIDYTTIYNFVDLTLYPPKEDLTIHGTFKLVCVGNLKHQKNLFYLVEAMSKITDQNIELHIYGGGPQFEQLKETIKKTNSPAFLHGPIKNINQVLGKYDLYVMSSFWEGFSLSVNEAMASRLPLLLSDIPSFREQAGDTALYFSLRNQQDFIEKVMMLKNNDSLRKELASKSYERVREKFTIEQHLKQLKALYWSKIRKH